MAEYTLDLTKCKLRDGGVFKKLGLTFVPLNTGKHYYDYDVAEDEIEADKLKVLHELNEAAILADPEIPGANSPEWIASRKSLPMGLDADDLPRGAVIRKGVTHAKT